MKRTLEDLLRAIREETRAEGPDGGGISDFVLLDAINSAQNDLAEMFPIRDIVSFTTVEDENVYDLADEITSVALDNIIRIRYDDEDLKGISLDDYLEISDPLDGALTRWSLWGTKLILIGRIDEDKEVSLYITRGPAPLLSASDTTELPYYVQDALIQYAVSGAYREMRDYDRANYHYGLYLRQKNSLLKRAVPQGQRDHRPRMRDSYWGVFRPSTGYYDQRKVWKDPPYDE